MSLPASLVQHLRAQVPFFADESERDQQALAEMLWRTLETTRQHHEYPGYASFPVRELDKIWGNARRMRNHADRYFTVLAGSNLTAASFTHGYKPTPQMQQALLDCLYSDGDEDWVEPGGKVRRTWPAAINSLATRSKDGRLVTRKSKWRGVAPAASVEVDIPGLQALAGSMRAEAWDVIGRLEGGGLGPEVAETQLARLALRLRWIAIIAKLARNKTRPGSVPIRYAEASTGRLFADEVALQMAPREVRNAALAGHWDYDIANCHFAMLAQLSQGHGHGLDAITHYLENKKQVREQLAREVGIAVDEVKHCLLALVYGARRSERPKDAIPAVIGVDAAQRLYSHPVFDALRADVHRARGAVLEALPTHAGGWVRNAMGLQVRRVDYVRNAAGLLAFVLQGFEAAALMAVVRRYGTDIKLCMHDGWVSSRRLPRTELEGLIFEATGLRLTVEERELPAVQQAVPGTESRGLQIKDVGSRFSFVNQYVTWFHEPSRLTHGRLPPPLSPALAAGATAPREPSDAERPVRGLLVSNRPAWSRPKGYIGSKPASKRK
jgi:hypothetical protein